MLIAHVSDTHIRNLKYHYEYRQAFADLYDKLRDQKPDIIVHTGDIAHTKTQLSPEYFELTSEFLNTLANIAPLYVILGNHDGNLKNIERQDAITPIVEALDNKNLHLLKDSGEVILENNVVLNVLSVFDRDNWVHPTDKSKINIALYHGSISGCETGQGFTITKVTTLLASSATLTLLCLETSTSDSRWTQKAVYGMPAQLYNRTTASHYAKAICFGTFIRRMIIVLNFMRYRTLDHS